MNYPEGTDARGTITANAAVNNLATGTVLTWVYLAKTGASAIYVCKTGGTLSGWRMRQDSTAGTSLQFQIDRATTDTNYVSTGTFPTGRWWCVGATWDRSGTPVVRLWVGYAAQYRPITELSPSIATDGSGAFSDDSANNLVFGNQDGGGAELGEGNIQTWAMVANVILTEAEMSMWAYQPWVAPRGCVVLNRPGSGGRQYSFNLVNNNRQMAVLGQGTGRNDSNRDWPTQFDNRRYYWNPAMNVSNIHRLLLLGAG